VALYVYMKKVVTSGSVELKIIPREYITSGEVILRDRLKNTTQTYSATFGRSGNYLNVILTLDPVLIDGRQYDLWVISGSDNIVYKDTILASNQTLDQTTNDVYNINQGQYTEHNTGDNDFVII